MKTSASLVVLGLTSMSMFAATSTWDAASGLYPDQITPPYSLFDSSTGDPVLTGGVLSLSSPGSGEGELDYRHSDSVLLDQPNLTIEAIVRFVSGASTSSSRAPIGIAFTPAQNIGGRNVLWIQQDLIFLWNSTFGRGPSVSVDTDGTFHTYRIEVAGVTPGSVVNVYYDTGITPIVSGALVTGGATRNIDWGDLTIDAGGTSEWRRFTHNAAIPEPSASVLVTSAALSLALRRRRKAPWARFNTLRQSS